MSSPTPSTRYGPAGSAGVDRSFRVGADHLHRPVGYLLQVPPGAGDRAAGADPGHEVRHRPVGLRPDLRAGGGVVGGRVLRIRVLVGLPATGYLAHQPARDTVIGVRMVGRDRAGTDHHLGAVGAQHADLVLRHLVGADEDAAVAAFGGHDRQPRPGVARRGFHDRAARPELAGRFRGGDHPQRDAVLDRSARVEVLHLGQHLRPGDAAGHRAQPQQRGVPHQLAQRVIYLHGCPSGRCSQEHSLEETLC